MEEAQGFRALVENYGMTQEQAAASVGKSRSAVANSMRLLALEEPLRVLVEDGKLVVEHNEKGEVIMPRYKCVTTHTARRSGITNMYLTHKYSIVQMMHVSGHKTQKTFMDYIKLSSDEIADEIDAIANGAKSEVF